MLTCRDLMSEAGADRGGRADARLRRLLREMLTELPPEQLLHAAKKILREYEMA